MIRDIKSIPVLRPFFGMVLGIIVEKWIRIPIQLPIICIVFSFIFLLSVLIFRLKFKPNSSWIQGIAVFLVFISAGTLLIKRFRAENRLIPETTKEFWLGEILSEPVIKNKLARFEMDVFIDSGFNKCSRTQVLMQISNGFVLPHVRQIIVMKTMPERIPGPANPGEFDYASYLESIGILYRCFVKEGEWKILGSTKKKTINSFALQVKNQLWEKIENLESGNKNLGVLYAISLGSKDLLTPEIKESYAVTGAMHVLVVSGQHIALIWMVLSYIFVWLRDIPGGKYLQFFLIAGLIWFYSFMTGITASVVRASGMFTLVSLGKIIQKESSIYNSLSVSAFFGLLIFPQWLTDAGFQLSYIAVLSIVFFQPKISSLWEPRNWLIQKLWEITAVSIAAQIGTLPLTLFYFNRFPPWFILSNIIVIPIVTIIMIIFIIMILFMMIPLVFSLLLKTILFLIGVMNVSLGYIEKLPTPGMDRIYLSGFQMFWFVFILLGITFFISYKKNYFIIVGLVSFLFIISAGTFRRYISFHQNEIILFSMPGKMMLGLLENKHGMFIHNAADTANIERTFKYKCNPYIIQNGIRKYELTGLYDSLKFQSGFRMIPGKQNFFCRYEGMGILILNDPGYYAGMRSDKLLFSDILIVNARIPRLWKSQEPVFFSRQLVISSAYPGSKPFTQGNNCIIRYDSIFDVRLNGAFRHSVIPKSPGPVSQPLAHLRYNRQ